ncbi:endonuclease/exonuclease/phosphatase family protein [Pseudoxanthomonas gei]|uniref:Endonuclease/exonuclease/phosphatase family protein n=1 Tax=Pseudoxanthomonas gei TaxID=1383030 RepID=A0ABX0AEZ1_9GAMM|nr:endonuclease/exonuclease/phosphatase family protein [Pseudoxanthomonas gei]NDK40169.1 endonuclease/exonuclease/phosphatase family protein [Pseudoxanthomonas gei]
MKRLACLCLLLLLSCASTTQVPPAHADGTLAVRIVTLNLYHDKDDWPARRVQIVETLRRMQPDVIALQEVLQHPDLENQARWLASELGYQWEFFSTDAPGKPRRYGNAILSRHRVLMRGQEVLRPTDDNRTVGLVRIELDGHPLNVYVTHLHWTDAGTGIRAAQVADLVRYIGTTSAGLPSLVAGDFNAAADAPELALLRQDFADTYGSLHPQADAIASSTLNLKYFAPRRIDHVFHQCNAFAPVASEILFTRPDAAGVWASDHFGLYAHLRLTAGQPQPHCGGRQGRAR